ncbi:hypothetical protein Tco_0581165 [Tanacetum coccineum]
MVPPKVKPQSSKPDVEVEEKIVKAGVVEESLAILFQSCTHVFRTPCGCGDVALEKLTMFQLEEEWSRISINLPGVSFNFTYVVASFQIYSFGHDVSTGIASNQKS